MKTKTKILNLIGFIGYSLLCIKKVNGELPKCEYEDNGSLKSSIQNCYDNDKKLLYIDRSEINAEENIFLQKDNKKVENFDNTAQSGYKCINTSKDSKDKKIQCTSIESEGLYKITINSNDGYCNVYKKDNSLAYQLINPNNKIELNKGSDSLTKALIYCESESKCDFRTPNEDDIYLTADKQKLIKCSSKNCVSSDQTESAIFLNAIGSNKDSLIKCTKKEKNTESNGTKREENYAECEEISGSDDSYYINGWKDKSIIYCGSNACNVYKDLENSYYINGNYDLNNGDEKQLISCHNGSCSLQKEEEYGHYLTKPLSNEPKVSVIECKDKKCSVTLKETQGYYRNFDDNTNTTYPLIQCSSSSCSSLKIGQDILPGYYVDISEGTPKVLVCNDNNCVEDENSKYKADKDKNSIANGKYDIKDGSLKLVVDAKAESDDDIYSGVNSSTSKEDGYYYNVEITSNTAFPGINTQVTTLFIVSKYYIARVISDGVIYINDSENKIITTSGTPGSESTIYTCVKSKKTCTASKSCTPDTYFLDSTNNIGYYCNTKGSVEQITVAGYYIDSSNGSSKRNLIYCENSSSGTTCTSNASANYFVNAGSDNSSKPLIYCNSSLCYVTSATSGYYLNGAKVNGNYGIINCTSSTSCEEVSMGGVKKTEHYYINSGADNIQKPLIKCKNKACSTVNASEGYFITNDVSNLIGCENASNCSVISASVGFYNAAVTVDTGKKVIECSNLATVTCELKDANIGYYVSKTANVLINCNVTPCKAVTVTNGIYRSATTKVISTKRDTIPGEEDDDEVNNKERANSSVVYNIISCTNTGCNELSTSELSAIPVCTFSNNKCFIDNRVSISTTTVSSISAGGYCTNSDRSVFYFATDTVVIDPYIIDGTTAIYAITTTTTNCIEALDKYSTNYYTVGSSIYKVSESSITQLVATGYYFINVETDTLITSNSIENYNGDNVKLFRCNDNSCSIVDKPDTVTYYADVNKRIIKYNPNSDSYTFAYENDIICIYSNNKCTPRADVKNMEFCITYKGELCLVTNDIKSRETGECYKADNISSKIYGSSQYMYLMNSFAAERIVDTAYYVISLSTNSTATIRDYDGRNNSLKIYGCVESKCDVQEPDENVYYYDSISRYMFRYDGEKWNSPQGAGYALVSVSPGDTYINRFSLNNNRTIIDGKVRSGYYYTIDKEMYECDQDKYQCEKISNSGYYFTVSGEIYQCIYDSEGLEETECIKKNCIVGQYYYLNSKYYYCSSGYMLNLVSDKTCEYDDKVIINFPVAFSESYPDKIKSAVENISLINNSTALVTNLNAKYISSVSGVFTNCTYTVEEKDSEFDLVCVNNFVAVNEQTDNVEICSLTHMGYTECVEDENNPEKCNPSGAISQYKKGLTFVITLVISTLLFFL